jgi:hypothetical protein
MAGPIPDGVMPFYRDRRDKPGDDTRMWFKTAGNCCIARTRGNVIPEAARNEFWL